MVAFNISLVALVASIFATALAAPTPSSAQTAQPVERASELFSNAPIDYTGPWNNFPSMDSWKSFDDMFSANKPSMITAGSTSADVDCIKVAIQDVSASIGVDGRVILGIIMEESHGYVGVKTTWNADGQPTGGLMQASGCAGFDGQVNLPQADTTSMVTCGTQHYKQNLQNWGNANTAESIYPALREYNSGSVDSTNLSNAPNGAGNPYYVSDVSQRFQGWTD